MYPYESETTIQMRGKFKASIKTEASVESEETIYVTDGTGGPSLSWRTSQNLDLISIASPIVDGEPESKVGRIVSEYKDLFIGLRKLKGCQVKLHINEDIQPSAQPHRRMPFHVRKQLEEQLEKDEQQEVIERVDGPTPWVSSVVVAPIPKQPGKIRMCVNVRQANVAVQLET